MATVVLDPYTNESSWVLKSAVRLLEELRGCHARVNLLVTADETDTRQFLGPITDDFLTFTDPDRSVVKALGIETIPAFAFIRVDGTIDAITEGWNPAEWRQVAEAITAATAWRTPTIPLPGDPVHSLVPQLSANHPVNPPDQYRSRFLTFPFRASSTTFEKPSPRHGAA